MARAAGTAGRCSVTATTMARREIDAARAATSGQPAVARRPGQGHEEEPEAGAGGGGQQDLPGGPPVALGRLPGDEGDGGQGQGHSRAHADGRSPSARPVTTGTTADTTR
jgi:hypothetical protein